MRIGSHEIAVPVILAPMAGITDRPFRRLCRREGAGLAVSEMTTADVRLWHSRKSRRRLNLDGEPAPVSVQLAGHDPAQLAEAARRLADLGADMVDINMGCPAKKVCSVAAGSALLRDEPLVGRILEAVVRAVPVPVTLKIRTGYRRAERNGLRIARLAEAAGVSALAVHGRTREDLFTGAAEHDTAAAIKAAVRIPVIVNGDIDGPETARDVLVRTGCDAVMIGRAAWGRPWLFRQVAHFLDTGIRLPEPSALAIHGLVLDHLRAMYAFYGEYSGVRIARRHLAWYSRGRVGAGVFRAAVNGAETSADQLRLTRDYFMGLADSVVVPAAA